MAIIDYQACVRAFHEVFEGDMALTPGIPSPKVCDLRVSLIDEELAELDEAFAEENLVEVADALGDIIYVVFGAAIACGIDLGPVFEEIHRSNMTKVGGHRREDGKWIKPDSYSPAELAPILRAQGWAGYSSEPVTELWEA